MVSLSFCGITFQVLLVLPLLHVTQSASSTRDTGEVLASGDPEISKLVPRMGTLDVHQQEADEVSNTRFLGRKKMSTRTFGMLREEVAYLNQLNGGQSSNNASTSSRSALPLKNNININARPERLRNTSGGRPRTHRRLKVRIAGNFIPLNADYNVPRPHPPKNN